jgi:hypothetical protein
MTFQGVFRDMTFQASDRLKAMTFQGLGVSGRFRARFRGRGVSGRFRADVSRMRSGPVTFPRTRPFVISDLEFQVLPKGLTFQGWQSGRLDVFRTRRFGTQRFRARGERQGATFQDAGVPERVFRVPAFQVASRFKT